MSYTPTTWNNGDVVTAAKMNKIENGIAEAAESGGGGAFLVTFTYDEEDDPSFTCDKTYAEIMAAHEAGNIILGTFSNSCQYADKDQITVDVRYASFFVEEPEYTISFYFVSYPQDYNYGSKGAYNVSKVVISSNGSEEYIFASTFSTNLVDYYVSYENTTNDYSIDADAETLYSALEHGHLCVSNVTTYDGDVETIEVFVVNKVDKEYDSVSGEYNYTFYGRKFDGTAITITTS